jgi:hypothetical protein
LAAAPQAAGWRADWQSAPDELFLQRPRRALFLWPGGPVAVGGCHGGVSLQVCCYCSFVLIRVN